VQSPRAGVGAKANNATICARGTFYLALAGALNALDFTGPSFGAQNVRRACIRILTIENASVSDTFATGGLALRFTRGELRARIHATGVWDIALPSGARTRVRPVAGSSRHAGGVLGARGVARAGAFCASGI